MGRPEITTQLWEYKLLTLIFKFESLIKIVKSNNNFFIATWEFAYQKSDIILISSRTITQQLSAYYSDS